MSVVFPGSVGQLLKIFSSEDTKALDELTQELRDVVDSMVFPSEHAVEKSKDVMAAHDDIKN